MELKISTKVARVVRDIAADIETKTTPENFSDLQDLDISSWEAEQRKIRADYRKLYGRLIPKGER